MLAEERNWFDMAANPFVLGESAEPHAFLLSCGVAYYTDAPRIDMHEALAKPLRTEGFPARTRHGGRVKRPRRGAYAIEEALVLDDSTLAVEGRILYAPICTVMFLRRDALPEKMIYSEGTPLDMTAGRPGRGRASP